MRSQQINLFSKMENSSGVYRRHNNGPKTYPAALLTWHWKNLLPEFFNTIQSNLFTECIQDQFRKDCTSKHVGPIVSYEGFLGILTLKAVLNSNIEGILSYCCYHITQRYIISQKIKKYISELSTVKCSSSSNYPQIRLKSMMYEYQLETCSKL